MTFFFLCAIFTFVLLAPCISWPIFKSMYVWCLRCRLSNREVSFVSIQSVAATAAALCMLYLRCCSNAAVSYCSSSCAGWSNSLLVLWIWSPCSLSLHSDAIYFSCTPWQCRRIYGLDLPTYSVITDMRGAKAGVSPPRRSPPCNQITFALISSWKQGKLEEREI